MLKKAFGDNPNQYQIDRLDYLEAKYNDPWNTYLKLNNNQFIEIFYPEQRLDNKDDLEYIGFNNVIIEVEDIEKILEILKLTYKNNENIIKHLAYFDEDNNHFIFIESKDHKVGLNSVVFFTNNYEEMVEFYSDKLLLDIISTNELETVFNVNDNQYIRIVKKDALLNIDYESHYGFRHICIEVSDIKKSRELLIKNGLSPDSEIRRGIDKSYQFWISDPDGNKYELMEYTPVSKQVKYNM